ncbi:hypothetical protein HanPI659440_Chr05g0199571 [Helianthus annuus]|nr:hypothetical protein HanPI659440_Chr05g0199571 [Helianthus annuus]
MVLPLQTLIFISSFFCRSFLFARNQDFKITKNRINNQHNMRDRGGIGGTAPAFLLNLLGFWHCLQICHIVMIIRRQVIARVGFRHCVQIINYLGFWRTLCGPVKCWKRVLDSTCWSFEGIWFL